MKFKVEITQAYKAYRSIVHEVEAENEEEALECDAPNFTDDWNTFWDLQDEGREIVGGVRIDET